MSEEREDQDAACVLIQIEDNVVEASVTSSPLLADDPQRLFDCFLIGLRVAAERCGWDREQTFEEARERLASQDRLRFGNFRVIDGEGCAEENGDSDEPEDQ